MKNIVKNNNDKIDTKILLNKLNISNDVLSSEKLKMLHAKGFLLIPPTQQILKKLDKLNEISNRLIKVEGDKGGWEGKEKFYKKGNFFEKGTNRLGNLIEKDQIFEDLILIPEILVAAYEIIKSDIKIGGVDLRNPLKNCGRQALHIDWKPREKTSEPYTGVVCFIYLDDINLENGAIRVVPESHKKIGWPDDHVDIFAFHKNEVNLAGPAGSILIMNLNLWHGGAKNISGNPRKTIFIDIRRRDEPQLLNFKKYLKDKTKKKLSPHHKYLLGIRECDKTQKEDSIGPGEIYRKRFGDKRDDFEFNRQYHGKF